MGSPHRHKRTLLVVDRFRGRGHRRDGVIVPARVVAVVVVEPRRRSLGVRPAVVNFVSERRVAGVSVESLAGIHTAWARSGRIRALVRRPAVNVLMRTLLLLLGTQSLLLLLQPRCTAKQTEGLLVDAHDQ